MKETFIDPIIEQLIDIYFHEEEWHNEKLTPDEAIKYYTRLYNNGNIQVYEEDGRVLGYYEVWRVTFHQFGRLICQAPFASYLEDIMSGDIAYVANVWISSRHRRSKVFKNLMRRFFEQNHDCEYYVGEAIRKRTSLVKVFKKSELSTKLFTEGVI